MTTIPFVLAAFAAIVVLAGCAASTPPVALISPNVVYTTTPGPNGSPVPDVSPASR